MKMPENVEKLFTMVSNKNELLIIIRDYVKEMERFYLDEKKLSKIIETNTNMISCDIEGLSATFKQAQKVLEYIRKGHNYQIVVEDIDNYMIGLVTPKIKIKVWGRDTWRKNENQEFSVFLNPDQYTKHYDRYIRKQKLKRILK